MNIHKPTPFLVRWHYSRYGAFIRRHKWFFAGWMNPNIGLPSLALSPYVILLIFVPFGLAFLVEDHVLASIVFIFTILHMFAWLILVLVAVRNPKDLS